MVDEQSGRYPIRVYDHGDKYWLEVEVDHGNYTIRYHDSVNKRSWFDQNSLDNRIISKARRLRQHVAESEQARLVEKTELKRLEALIND